MSFRWLTYAAKRYSICRCKNFSTFKFSCARFSSTLKTVTGFSSLFFVEYANQQQKKQTLFFFGCVCGRVLQLMTLEQIQSSDIPVIQSKPDEKETKMNEEQTKSKEEKAEERKMKKEEKKKKKEEKKNKKQEIEKAKEMKMLSKEESEMKGKEKEKKQWRSKGESEIPLYHDCDDVQRKKKCSLAEAMSKHYDPSEVEKDWDKYWEEQDFYKPEMNSTKEKFVMVIPPPNVTGNLHLGHALMATIEDCITRYWRMQGKNCLWLPGTDHAGIATQAVVERRLLREGKYKQQMGRDKFLEQVWQWKNQFGGKICAQLRRMGCSVDWSREVFTMDDKLSRAVIEAFVKLHQKGLIYRANGLCHWSCHLQSAISNIEIDTVELEHPTKLTIPGYNTPIEFGLLYEFKYPILEDNAQYHDNLSSETIVVATTRIETMLGDIAIAVHPDDLRYKKYHGKYVWHPFLKRRMPIICDSFVDPDFGTGAVKITPAHDENDFECAKRHNLPLINILTEDGRINEHGGTLFAGQLRYDARKTVIKELSKLGLFVSAKSHKMALQMCSRSKDVIEPYLKPQWYVNCTSMAQNALNTVFVDKALKFTPAVEGERQWRYFLENIRPWCISRQLWWGHRIPAWKLCTSNTTRLSEQSTSLLDLHEEWIIARSESEAYQIAYEKSGCIGYMVFQWLFPFSAMGWPDLSSADLKEFFPTTLLETGGDILFFWVARMVMMSLELTGRLPFEHVLLHPMVCDKDGGKMSKSKGNVIDPLYIIDGIDLKTLIDELYSGNIRDSEIQMYVNKKKQDFPNGIPPCGADALRFGLLRYLTQHRNINLDVARIIGYRQFGNKIWNAVRFSLSKFGVDYVPPSISTFNDDTMTHSSFVDQWILSKLNYVIHQCQIGNSSYRFDQSTEIVYQFFTRELCDVYLELIKSTFETNEKAAQVVKDILYICIDLSLKLMHPFMPFITEELWQRLPGSRSLRDSLIVQTYPEPVPGWTNIDVENQMDALLHVVKNIRSDKQTVFNLPTKTQYDIFIHVTSPLIFQTLQVHKDIIQTLGMIRHVSIIQGDVSDSAHFKNWPMNKHQIVFEGETTAYTCYHNVELDTDCIKQNLIEKV
ncbi:hypothetical protein RFI_08286 [Reticulomyxa filosa]|uniref:valine--tRNA ligase n=1 Tax=Reticulomyxa filosa TaxID=46433 RepID=X6NSV1_RETFI|nr:hypothetical protein RFI_08286 [Reticulomyxa filosa]|eukprot:ETO28839.1 hypothetical protein RFI_08286 [Reticulomyxa filosa]